MLTDNHRGYGIRLVICLLLLSSFSLAKESGSDIWAGKAWARATPPGSQSAAVYFDLINESALDVEISGISSSVSDQAYFHETRHIDGMMKMGPVAVYDLGAGQSVSFRPGGTHIMLVGLFEPLESGTSFDLELILGSLERLHLSVKVGSINQLTSP